MEKISVVLPAHNEAEGIGRALQEIGRVVEQAGAEVELIVVDDGSGDATYETVCRLAEEDARIRAMRFSRNFGKEAALLAGLEAASGNAVITMDADLQHPPALIPSMIDHWRQGAKIIHGVKEDRSEDSSIARFRAALFNNLLARLGGVDVRNSSDFKLLDRVVVDVLVNSLPERRRFYRGLAGWIGYQQVSLPFTVAARESGRGKWSLIALLDLAATAIVSFTSAPLRVVTVLGAFTLVFGFFVAMDAVWSWAQGEAVSGFATIIITLLLLGSFIMISLGVIGEYIAKIYDEIKRRPAYLVESRYGFDEREGSNS
jgi:glycosyltransferase involved in cell wall biosynthesis